MKKGKHHNIKVAKARGPSWLLALREGRAQAREYPSELALARLNRKLRQQDIAAKLEMSLSTYCAIERGRRPVKLLMARLISKEVGKPLNTVFYEDDKIEKYFVKCVAKQGVKKK